MSMLTKIKRMLSKKRNQRESEILAEKLSKYPSSVRDRLRAVANRYDIFEVLPFLSFRHITDALYDADEIRLVSDPFEHMGDKEVGGYIRYRIVNERGKKILELKLERAVEGGQKRIHIPDKLEEGVLGRWHTHPSGLPYVSEGDLLSFYEGIHLVVGKDEARLYLHNFYKDISNLKNTKPYRINMKNRERAKIYSTLSYGLSFISIPRKKKSLK